MKNLSYREHKREQNVFFKAKKVYYRMQCLNFHNITFGSYLGDYLYPETIFLLGKAKDRQ